MIRPAASAVGAAKCQYMLVGVDPADTTDWSRSEYLTDEIRTTYLDNKVKSIEFRVTDVRDEGTNHYRFKGINVTKGSGDTTTYDTMEISLNQRDTFGNMTIEVDCTKGYYVTATQAPNGTITPSGATWVEAGERATYEFKPDAGYMVERVLLDGHEVPPDQ